jgi:hypothetical protein
MAVALLVGTGAAATALAQMGGAWSAPVALSAPPPPCVPAKCATFPQLAVNARGNAVASWRRYVGFGQSRPSGFDCQLSLRRPGGSWSAPEAVPGGACPSLALGPDGSVLAVWTASQGGRTVVLAQTRTPEGEWRSRQRLSRSDEDASIPQVEVADHAGAVAVWSSRRAGGDYVIEGAAQGRGRGFGSPQVASGGVSSTTSLRLAVDDRGDAIAGWSTSSRGQTSALVAFRPAGGRWQAPQLLARSREFVSTPAVALDSRGAAIAVWSEHRQGTGALLRTAFAPAGGTFGRPRLLAGRGAAPEVAFDARGNAVAVWEDDQAAVAALRPAGGSWQPAQVISAPGMRVGTIVVAVSPGGDAIAVWVRLAFTDSGRLDVVQASVRPAGGRFGAARDISQPGVLGGSPQVGMDARGNAVAIWEGAGAVVEAATYAK